MAALSPPLARALVLTLGAAALVAGMAVGTLGCGPCIRPCPKATPIELGAYEVLESPDRPELVGALVEFTAARIEISYADAEGHEWVVDYVRE